MEEYNPKGYLTDNEWLELVALEYVLTWNYSEKGEQENDEKRHKELSNKKDNKFLTMKSIMHVKD